MGSLENGFSMKKERERAKPRSNKLARFVLFGKIDYLQWVCAVGVFFFFIVLFQMLLPGSVIENSKGEVMTWQMISELDFGEGVEFEPKRGFLTRFNKDLSTRGVRFGTRKPFIALVFADLLIDPHQIQMVTVAIALKEIGYKIEVIAVENGVAGDIWKKLGIPITIFRTEENKEVVVDWLRFDGIIVNSIEAKEPFSRLLQEPFKSIPVIWSINDRTLCMHLRQCQSDGEFDLVNEWQKLFNRSSVVVFPNYALPMYYSPYDSGNFIVVPGSPAEAWEANNLIVSHKDNTSENTNNGPNNFVIVIVGSQFMYKGLWLEHALVLKALLPLLPEFSLSLEKESTSRLKIIFLTGDSTRNYSMAMEAVASNLKYPKDMIRHAAADEDANNIISMSNLVIYGSFLEEHSFPSILLKAMSYGKPIIAPNLAMISKYVDDRVTGYLYPKENIWVLSQILMLAISEGNLSPLAHEIALRGKDSAQNLMVSETVEGYAYLLENIIKLPSEVVLTKPVTEIPSVLKEEWQWKFFESVSYPETPKKAHNFLENIRKQWRNKDNIGALSASDETFLYALWEEEKSNDIIMNAKKRREEDQLKDRTDQTRGTWEEVYRNAKKADRTKNVLHEREDGELERTGQPLTIYEPYFGEGTWPFLHRNSLYRGLGLSTKGRRPGTDDIDAPSRLPLLNNIYYRDVIGEFGGFFALANRVDRVHKNAWIGFQSWRATARKESLSKAAETAILEAIQSRRHGDTLYFWSRMDMDPRNPSKQDFWSFCDAINAGNCKFAYSEAMKKMYGIKDADFTLPPMPIGDDTWSVMHSWALPTKSFLEFVMFSRIFVDTLDAQFYDEHRQTGHCRLSLSKDKHCYSRVLELLVNVWAYHSARKMVYVNPESGAIQEQHKLKGRRGKMWVKWFSFHVLKSMDEDLAEEFDSENPRKRWLWPNTGEVFWQGMSERERHMRNKEKEEKKRKRKEKMDRMSKRHGQKTIGKYIKPPREEVELNSTVAKVLR